MAGEAENLTWARATLEATPGRAATFLRGVPSSPEVRMTLGQRGYDAAEHAAGIAQLTACLVADDAAFRAVETDVQQAVATVDAWDEPGLDIIRATLEHRFPEQARLVLDGIVTRTGPDAVPGVRAILDRLDALAESPARQATRTEDRVALDLLARRGVTAEERARLQGLVERAMSAPSLGAAARAEADAAHLTRLRALRGWYDEWAAVARAVLHRREHLEHLGLQPHREERQSEIG